MKKIIFILLVILPSISYGQMILSNGVRRVIPAAAAGTTLDNGLVAYWQMDEASGTVYDETANNNDGTGTGIAQSTTGGKIGGAVTFDATDEIDCGNGASLTLDSKGTISAWVYPTTLQLYGAVVSKFNFSTDRNGYGIRVSTSGRITLELANGTTNQNIQSSTDAVIAINGWYHIVATWDGTYVNIYLNGVKRATNVSQTVTPVSNVYNFHIGRDAVYTSTNGNWNGLIDEVAVYNRVLGQSGVDSLYNSGNGITYPFE